MDGDGVKDILTGKRYWAHGPEHDPEPNAPAVLYWLKCVRDGDGKTSGAAHFEQIRSEPDERYEDAIRR